MLQEFRNILLFVIGGTLFAVVIGLLSRLLAPHRPYAAKMTTYESGEEPEGEAVVQFNPRFYIIGLVFLLFDVEVLFLFPWATVFADKELVAQIPGWGWMAMAEMSVFVLLLALGLAYVWAKGDLEWIKPQPVIPAVDHATPEAMYQQVNQKYS